MTRPRPRTAPVMTGAVDLSGLKQRAQSGSADGRGVEIAEANLEAEVLVRSGKVPVVVVLWSPRSEASIALVDALSALAGADKGQWALATVNVDAAPRVGAMFGIEAVPTVVALAAGQPIASFEGVQAPAQLRKWIDSLLAATAGKLTGGAAGGAEAETVDPAIIEARAKLDAGDFIGAGAAYRAVLAADPNHPEATGALRQVDFLQRASAHQPGAVARADADPGDIDAALAAADVELMSQEVVGAFDRLTNLVKRTAGEDRARVRSRLVELFELFDPADPDVIAGRRKLANALF